MIVDEKLTTYFRSVIALVYSIQVIRPEEAKYKEITGCTQAYFIAIDVEHITGKEAIEFVNAIRL